MVEGLNGTLALHFFKQILLGLYHLNVNIKRLYKKKNTIQKKKNRMEILLSDTVKVSALFSKVIPALLFSQMNLDPAKKSHSEECHHQEDNCKCIKLSNTI